MKQFALIVDGRVAEVFLESIEMEFPGVVIEDDPTPAPVIRSVPLAERYTADFIAGLVPYDPLNPPEPPAPPAAPTPTVVTMRQARLALLAVGKLAAVETAIDALPSPQKEAARIEWDYSDKVERASKIVALLGPTLQLDDKALDALFTAASQL